MTSILGAIIGLLPPPLSPPATAGSSLPHASWRLVHSDPALLVVNKGAGLLSVPGVGAAKADCLLSRMRASGFPEVSHAPHRLDRDTSGLLALGRSAAAHRSLCAQFERRRVAKRYEALVLGWPAEEVRPIRAHTCVRARVRAVHGARHLMPPRAAALSPTRLVGGEETLPRHFLDTSPTRLVGDTS